MDHPKFWFSSFPFPGIGWQNRWSHNIDKTGYHGSILVTGDRQCNC